MGDGGQPARDATFALQPRLLWAATPDPFPSRLTRLDTKSEKEVQHALNTLMAENKGTCIAIAHRLSTIMDSDQIAVVKDKVTETGFGVRAWGEGLG